MLAAKEGYGWRAGDLDPAREDPFPAVVTEPQRGEIGRRPVVAVGRRPDL